MPTIRPCRPADHSRIEQITVDSFEEVSIDRNIEASFGHVNRRTWQERKARNVASDLVANPGGVFVAEEQGEVVGYLTTCLDPFTGIGRIPNLAVDAGARGKGIGSALIERALEYLREQGMVMAKIETLAQNERGQALYPRFGFREVARQIHYAMPLDTPGRSEAEDPAG